MCTFVYTFIITRMTQLSTSTMHQWIIILRKQIISLEKFHFNLHLSCKNIHHVEERKEEEKTGLKHLEPQYCFFMIKAQNMGFVSFWYILYEITCFDVLKLNDVLDWKTYISELFLFFWHFHVLMCRNRDFKNAAAKTSRGEWMTRKL